ncbi:sulfatase [Limihaloglobus sulfuriphilus]|uniref:sulfatase family protein n=1 Tax=Limihaloglobus sulfuriphilus TaxID=1851148 RepID=UPI001C9A205C|nr:sulfatase-like hydrolase/transferase [Limihaloglobus sulfuriphilus]
MKTALFSTAFVSGVSGMGSRPSEQSNADKAKPRRRPNILWIMFDDGRADALGCYGTKWANTPNIDRIAQNGVLFTTAIVQNPVCVPSRRSMKTGNYCHQSGPMAMGKAAQQTPAYMKGKDKGVWDREAILQSLGLVEQSGDSGIEDVPNLLDIWTRAQMKPINIGKIHGFHDQWDSLGDAEQLLDVFGKPTAFFKQKYPDAAERILSSVRTKTYNWQIGGVLDVKPEDTTPWRLGDMAVKKIDQLSKQEEPFFLRVSFHAPHVPCHVPKEFFVDPEKIELPLPDKTQLESKPEFEKNCLRKYAGSLDLTKEEIDISRGTYYGMAGLVDVQVGRIVKELEKTGLLDNTIIAVNSDQGFGLGEHGLWKKRAFYEDYVKSPLIINCPERLPGGKRIDEPVEMIDFLPTLLELSDLEIPDAIRGKSLVPLITGKVKKWRRACFCEIDHSSSMYNELRNGTGRRVMVRTKNYKLIFFMDERVKDKDGALYDLKNDPGEIRNLYNDSKYTHVIDELESYAYQWSKGEFF